MDAMRLEILLMSDKIIIIPIMVEFCFLNNYLKILEEDFCSSSSYILFLSVAMEANWSMVL